MNDHSFEIFTCGSKREMIWPYFAQHKWQLACFHEQETSGSGGGGGFFLACEDFGRMFNDPFPACAFFFFFF